ncbi:hypothetical protein [Thalassobacillus sp. C254]|uniref:hypothetical protein n=1 Tax=Thalassobacillus sp. C254 TaxID=1225341 RepID=UPI0012ED369E|nr:hypothetical protein [Thalassobacillus sp. C254]
MKKTAIIIVIVLGVLIAGGWGSYSFLAGSFGDSGETTLSEAQDAGAISEQEMSDLIEEETDDSEERTSEEIESEIKEEIARQHTYWNDLTGYGGLDSLSMDEAASSLEEQQEKIQDRLLPIATDSLKEDFKTADSHISAAIEDNNPEELRMVHRIFHDLDIVINDYSGDTNYFGVTETFGND